jgi:glycosyltransferase involved in cell wall biosynthesis
MRLVFVTQQVDADHPVLAQTVDVLLELAARFESVDVLCDAIGRHDMPPNVTLRTFGAATRAGRGLRFERALAAALRHRPDAVLVHMVPLFVLLAAPLVKPRRIPLVLWYTHWHASRSLRLSLPLLDRVLSVSASSFPLPTPKLTATGHAIDVDTFAPAGRERAEGPLRLLAFGRTARWKGYDTMLAAVELASARGHEVELEIRGPQLTEDERAHRRELESAIAASPVLSACARVEPPLPRDELPAVIAAADAVVSATQPRASETLDKVVYEAAACGVPVVSSNSALDDFLGGLPLRLRFPPRDAEALAERIADLVAATPAEREAVGAELRRRVVEGHSVRSWAAAVAGIVAGQGPG